MFKQVLLLLNWLINNYVNNQTIRNILLQYSK